MEKIRLISTSTIRPTNVTSHRIDLTPSDLLLINLDHIQKGLLFHKPQSLSLNNNSDWIQHLKTSLSKTLDIFYPLAGRLIMLQNDDVDRTKSFFIDCNGQGASFVHAAIDGVKLADVLDPVYIPDDVVYSFFPMNGALNFEGVAKPLLAVQVTELEDAVFVACTMNHSVVDGTSFWQFFNTWSQISCGVVISVLPLVFSRDQFFDSININLPLRIPFDPEKIPRNILLFPPLQQRMFRFSKEKIAELKAKANAEMGFTNNMMTISSLQALMAHLWVSITRNRRLNAEEAVVYTVSVGLRRRTEPPLPEGYFGNAVFLGTVKATAGELTERGLGWAAWQMNRMIVSQTPAQVRKFLLDWAISPKFSEHLQGYNLGTGSSPWFNVYGNDFGWGRPVGVRSGPGNKFDGKLTVFPGAEEGSVDFEVCLRSETFQSMDDDAEFLETLAI